MADEIDPSQWAAHSAGEGTKGLRLYDWARIPLSWAHAPEFERWVLIRRNRQAPYSKRDFFPTLRLEA